MPPADREWIDRVIEARDRRAPFEPDTTIDVPLVTAQEIDALAPRRWLLDGAYQVGLALFDNDHRMVPGERRPIYIRVENRGSAWWPWGWEQEPPIRVTYHWRTADGDMLTYEGIRSPLSARGSGGDRGDPHRSGHVEPGGGGRAGAVSGIDHLRNVLRWQLTERSRALKARSSLATLASVLRSPQWPDAERFRSRLEMVSASAHEIVEIHLLNALWLGELELRDADQVAEMERLLGGKGTAVPSRLGVAESAPVDEQRTAALVALERWSRIAEHPLSSVQVKAAARGVARSCEGILAGLQ